VIADLAYFVGVVANPILTPALGLLLVYIVALTGRDASGGA
jgi:hypothetical protein